MGFFDVPPPARAEDDNDLDDEQEEYLEGRWLPGVLPVGQFIGRSEQAAVAARRILVLPDGFEIDIIAWVRKPPKRGHYLYGPFDREIVLAANGPEEIWDQNGRLSDQLVRFGVQFADGGRVTNLDQEPDWPDATDPAHGMTAHAGSASAGDAEQDFWIWPVPADGDLELVCEWPAYGIAESRLRIDGDSLRAAAGRAQPVWPDEPAPTEVYGTSVLSTRSAHIVARRTADLAAEAPEPGEAD
jgi:hypothetical protein